MLFPRERERKSWALARTASNLTKPFRRSTRLPFILLADTDHAVSEAYGVWALKNDGQGILRHSRRHMSLKEGKIVGVYEKVKT